MEVQLSSELQWGQTEGELRSLHNDVASSNHVSWSVPATAIDL